MNEIQHLMVRSYGSVNMTCELDWQHHLVWFEVRKGAKFVKCKYLFEAHVEFNRMAGKDDL